MASFSGIGLLFLVAAGLVACNEQKNITAESGQTVGLPCRAPDDKPVEAVQWKRTDLGSEYVLLCTDGQCDEDYQHPFSQNRADLDDREMKNGNATLILRNVTYNDTGTYECYVFQKETDNIKRADDPISIIHLNVSSSGRTQDGGDKDGNQDGGDKDGNQDGGDKDGNQDGGDKDGNQDGGDTDGGEKDGRKKDGRKKDGGPNRHVGLGVGLTVVVILVGVFGVLIYKKKKEPYQQPPEQIV